MIFSRTPAAFVSLISPEVPLGICSSIRSGIPQWIHLRIASRSLCHRYLNDFSCFLSHGSFRDLFRNFCRNSFIYSSRDFSSISHRLRLAIPPAIHSGFFSEIFQGILQGFFDVIPSEIPSLIFPGTPK